MEQRDYLVILYDYYGELLNEDNKKYFEDYYFDNLSLGEMSDAYDVSRNAIFKQIHITVAKLEEYEDALHLYQKKKKLEEALDFSSIDDVKKRIEDVL